MCSLAALAQPGAGNEKSLKTDEPAATEIESVKTTPSRRFGDFLARNRRFRAPHEIFRENGANFSAFIDAGRFAIARHTFAAGRRRTSLHYLLTSATGITQAGEATPVENRFLVSSNGRPPTANHFAVDNFSMNLGVSSDESSLARNLGLLPALTASGGLNSFAVSSQMQELTVKTMSGAKEQRVGGADVNIVGRAGNNSFRGSLFETFGSEKLNANDFFANSRALPRAPARLNQFGGALGGFLRRDVAWFFVNYEGLRLRQPGFSVTEVPSFAARQAASGARRELFEAFPLPSNGGRETSNGFAESAATYANPAAHNVVGLRLDLQPRNGWRLGARYNLAVSDAALRADRDLSLNTARRLDTQTDSFSLWTSSAPRSNLVFDGRVNFSRHRIGQEFTLDDFGGANPPPAAISSMPFDFLKFDLAGKNAALAAGRPIASRVGQFQASGRMDWIASRHFMTFGADYRRLSLDIGAARAAREVLLERTAPDLNTSTARVVGLTRSLAEKPSIGNLSLFAQDNFNVSSRLNLNFGLRWDADIAPAMSAENIRFRDASLRVPSNFGKVAPRAAATFALTDSGRSVLRAGAGLYYDYGNGAASDAFANSFPFASGAYARGADLTSVPDAPVRPLQLFADDLQTPRSWHVFAEFQQELWRNHILTATFTTSASRKLFLTRTLLDADPVYNYIRLTGNDGAARFNALQLRFERRFSAGFSFNARYAFSKTTDNFSPDAMRETNLVSEDLTRDRGAADFDVRHQLAAHGVYEIPTFFSSGWTKRLTEDWSLAVFANARSAFPLSAGYERVNDFGRQFVRADRVGGVPLYLTENSIKTLNPNAFRRPAENRQGDLGRNSLRGFSFFQLDASLQRRIRFTNETRLELAASAYNLLNNTNFADPRASLGTLIRNGKFLPNEYFGKATATYGGAGFTPFYLYGGARTLRLSARFIF